MLSALSILAAKAVELSQISRARDFFKDIVLLAPQPQDTGAEEDDCKAESYVKTTMIDADGNTMVMTTFTTITNNKDGTETVVVEK